MKRLMKNLGLFLVQLGATLLTWLMPSWSRVTPVEAEVGPGPYRRARIGANPPGQTWLQRNSVRVGNYFDQRYVKIMWRMALLVALIYAGVLGLLTLAGVTIPQTTFSLPILDWSIFTVSRWTDVLGVFLVTALGVWGVSRFLEALKRENLKKIFINDSDDFFSECFSVIVLWFSIGVVGLVFSVCGELKDHSSSPNYVQDVHNSWTVFISIIGFLGLLFGGRLVFSKRRLALLQFHLAFLIPLFLLVRLAAAIAYGFAIGLSQVAFALIINLIGIALSYLVVSGVMSIGSTRTFLYRKILVPIGSFLAIVGRWLIAAPRLSTATKDFSDKSDSVDKKNESVKGVSGGGIAL